MGIGYPYPVATLALPGFFSPMVPILTVFSYRIAIPIPGGAVTTGYSIQFRNSSNRPGGYAGAFDGSGDSF